MLAVFLAIAAASAVQPSAVCTGADPAITYVGAQLIKRSNAPDHYVIESTITNTGSHGQTPDIAQQVVLIRNGVAFAPQTVPALGAGIAYKLAFAVYRPIAQRSEPLTVTIRYVLTAGDRTLNACNRSNDELTKTF